MQMLRLSSKTFVSSLAIDYVEVTPTLTKVFLRSGRTLDLTGGERETLHAWLGHAQVDASRYVRADDEPPF